MTSNSRLIHIGIGIGLVTALAVIGCSRTLASEDGTNTASAALASASSAPQVVAAKGVTRIVFVGKEHPCDCTKARLEAGRATLEAALGTPPKVPVEHLKIDTESDKVEPYRQQKPAMTLPALYFLDANNSVVELLQGEFTREQIAAILAK